jgi:hypothetical protein
MICFVTFNALLSLITPRKPIHVQYAEVPVLISEVERVERPFSSRYTCAEVPLKRKPMIRMISESRLHAVRASLSRFVTWQRRDYIGADNEGHHALLLRREGLDREVLG